MRLILIGIFLAFAFPASATNICAPYQQMVEKLLQKFGEVPHNMGTISRGNVIIKTLANRKTGTWTIISVRRDGIACLLIACENFTPIKQDVDI